MHASSKALTANGLLAFGLLPFAVVTAHMARTADYRGDAAMGAVFSIVFGLGIVYAAALAVVWPASMWSLSLAKAGTDSRSSHVLRLDSAAAAVVPVLAIFPVIVLTSLL